MATPSPSRTTTSSRAPPRSTRHPRRLACWPAASRRCGIALSESRPTRSPPSSPESSAGRGRSYHPALRILYHCTACQCAHLHRV
eukprot:scaffold5574_cov126-Isochrysis_galbana.AAC.3